MATYAVGDLQGCLQPLQCLLEEVGFEPSKDRLWLVGDLINRGPASLACLRFIYQMRSSIHCVLGNHDLHLLAVARGHRQPSRSDTLDEILSAPDANELLHWLRQQPLLYRDTELGYTMVHAGIAPQWTLEQACQYADEISRVLRGPQCDDFLAAMYGNHPTNWRDDLSGTERWRCITNYFTRMRFCRADGELDLENKGGVEIHAEKLTAEDLAPWFLHPERKTRCDPIIFGHWAALEGNANHEHVFALDTGCVWGGAMTMMRLEDQQLFRCNC